MNPVVVTRSDCYVAEVSDGAVTGFHHLALTVRDFDVSTSWYERLFDLDPVIDEPGDERRARVYRLRGTTRCSAWSSTEATTERGSDPIGPGSTTQRSRCRRGPTVDAWAQRLDVAGIEHSGRIDIPIGAILNFSDPDGIALSIFYEGD